MAGNVLIQAVEYPKFPIRLSISVIVRFLASESEETSEFQPKIDSLQFACHFLVTLHFQVCKRSKNRCLNVELIVFLT